MPLERRHTMIFPALAFICPIALTACESPGNGGCSQDLSEILVVNQPESLTGACGTTFHAECLESGCGSCEVCGADVSCYFSDCHCGGDGLCHRLCASDADCLGEDRCIVSLWSFSGSDLVDFPLSICWSGPEDEIHMWLI